LPQQSGCGQVKITFVAIATAAFRLELWLSDKIMNTTAFLARNIIIF
jgi:hypothetical protein